MAKRLTRVQRKTVLVVCEGPTDKAFIDHLVSCYGQSRNNTPPPKLTIRVAGGMGADHVIEKLIGHACYAAGGYDRLIAMYDADMPPSSAARKRLLSECRNKGEFLEIAPQCLEGLLLTILNLPANGDSAACKTRYQASHKGDMQDKASYASRFPRELLDARRKEIAPLNELIALFD